MVGFRKSPMKLHYISQIETNFWQSKEFSSGRFEEDEYDNEYVKEHSTDV